MKNITKISTSICLSIALISCGGEGGSKKALSADQKSKVISVIKETGGTLGTSHRVARNSAFSQFSKDTLSSENSPQEEKFRLMEDALSQCEMSYNNNSDFQNLLSMDLSFALNGAACPLELKVDTGVKAKESFGSYNIIGKFNFYYKTIDQSFLEYSSLKALDLSFGFDLVATQQSASGEITGGGYIETVEHGKIPLTVAGSMKLSENSSEISFGLEMKFEDFVALIQIEGKNEEQPKITLNGEEISEEELQELFQDTLSMN